MSDIIFSIITDEHEIDILRNMTSKYKDFVIKYDENILDLLKRNLKNEKNLYIVARQDGDFVAFCSADDEWWEDGYYMVREIFIKPDFQKQKIGETLMNMCIKHARQNGAVGVVTETSFENIPMQKLCAKLGFKKWDNPGWKDVITYKFWF